MRFTQLDARDYPRFLALYNEAFPIDERRVYESEKQLDTFINEHKGMFHILAVTDGEGDLDGKTVVGDTTPVIGFLSYWTFKGYVYIEHFALDPERRGNRIGTALLEHLFKTVGPDVLVEVEHPETPDAQRRIKFYERNGFRSRKEFDYLQPPYGKGQQEVPMMLMTHGNVKLNNKHDISEMLREVYNVENV